MVRSISARLATVIAVGSLFAASFTVAVDPAFAAAVTDKAVVSMASASAANALPTAAAIQVSWPSVPNAVAYVVTLSQGATVVSSQTISVISGADKYQTTFGSLSGGVSYSATVKSQGDSVSNFSTSDSVALVAQSGSDKPGIVSSTAKKASVDLVWSAPASTGGSAVTSYTISATNLATPVVVTAPATTKTISSLVAGTPYTFTIVANNANGASQPSQFDLATVLSAPGVPTITSAPVLTSSTLTTSWTAPTDLGGDSTSFGYYVTLYKDNTAVGDPVLEATTTHDFALTDSGSYTFKVAAKNSIGTGAQTSASSAVTYTAPTTITVPGAPTAPTTSLSSSTLSVSWRAPSDNGGSAITGYTVKLFKDTVLSSTSADLTDTSKSFTLTATGSYTVTVSAKNSAGYGSYSSASAAVAFTASGGGTGGGGTGGGGTGGGTTPTPTPTPTPSASTSATPTPSSSSAPVATPTPSSAPAPSQTPQPTQSPSASTKVLAPGITQYSNKQISGELLPKVSKPTTKVATAPSINVPVGKVFAPVVKSLPKSSAITATLIINGVKYPLGKFKTNANGSVQLSGLNLKKAGTYVIALKDANGVTYYVKVVVKPKK